MSEYVLGPEAVVDLEDIWDYIATGSIDAADRWIAKLFDAFDEIAPIPGIGHQREDLRNIRFCSGQPAHIRSFTAPGEANLWRLSR